MSLPKFQKQCRCKKQGLTLRYQFISFTKLKLVQFNTAALHGVYNVQLDCCVRELLLKLDYTHIYTYTYRHIHYTDILFPPQLYQ